MANTSIAKDRIFAKALEKPADERAEFLDEACGDDQTLRMEIEDLLACHEAAGSFLLNPPEAFAESKFRRDICESPGAVIGRYKLVKEIGEGGCGVVFMAEQQAPVKRCVALKIVKPGMDSKAVVARFEAERQALALMNHPHIAKILDAGTTESGRPFFVMDLVNGIPITEFCDANRLSTRGRLELFVSVCQAVQHAHQKGVIHRDLKPSNVMISMHDDKAAPMIIDFGVSKALGQKLTERTLFTAQGHLVGTPLYMSPEQADMSACDIDTRSDIYSLGVLLYELITGSTPLDPERLRGTSYAEMQRLIREEDPPTPSNRLSNLGGGLATIAQRHSTDPKRMRQSLCGDLDWIVLKALAKERDRRYATANDFANDLARLLRDETVEARPPSIGYRFRKFARRNRTAVVAGCMVMAAILLGIVGTTAGMMRANRARVQAEVNNERLNRQVYRQLIRLAQSELQAGRPVSGLRLLGRCLIRLRNWEWHYLYRLAHSERLEPSHEEMPGRVLSVDCSPANPEKAAVVTDNGSLVLLTMQEDLRSRVLVNRGGSSTGTWSEVPSSSVRFSPSGTQIAFAHGANPVSLTDVASGDEVCELSGHGAITDVAFHPDSNTRKLATASGDASIWFWASDGRRLAGSLDHDLWASCVAYSPNGRLIASGSFDKSVVIWTSETGERVHTLRLHTAPVTCVAFSHDGSLLATGSIDRSAIIWDVETGEEIVQLRGHQNMVTGIAFGKGDTRIATASTDQTVWIWEVDTGEAMLTLSQENANFSDVAFSCDGNRLVAASRTKTLTVWDASPVVPRNDHRVLSGHEGRIWDVAVLPEGHVLSAAEDGTVRTWNPWTGEELRQFKGHGNVVFDIALHPDGKHAASVGPFFGDLKRHGVIVWDPLSGDIVDQKGTLKETGIENREYHCVDFSPDGRWLATAGVQVVRAWDLNRRVVDQLGNEIGRHNGIVWSARFSSCGRYLATAGSAGSVKLWNAEHLDARQTARTFPVAKGHVTRLSFSPSGKYLAYGDADGSIVMIATGTAATESPKQFNWSAHGQRVRCVEFSPDGRHLASGSADETIKIWDVETRRLVHNILADGTVYSLAFSPDGEWLASGDGSEKVRIWDSGLWNDR